MSDIRDSGTSANGATDPGSPEPADPDPASPHSGARERGGKARLSQERSRVRREQILDAAAHLFGESGAKGITHRSLSEAMDAPLATVSYYFDSIDQVVDELLIRTLDRWTQMFAALRPDPAEELSAAAAGERVGDLLRQAEPIGYAYELRTYLAALGRPQLMPRVHEMQQAAMESIADLGRATGLQDPYWAAVRLAMMVGGALVSITDPETRIENMAEILADMCRRVFEDAARLEGRA